MKGFFSKRDFFSSVVSIVLSVAFVASIAYASSTISTNIQTDGTLSVTGASAFTGVGTFNGQLQASSTALFGSSVTAYAGLTVGSATVANSLDGTILLKAQTSDPVGVTQGTFYYNSTSKVLKMYDGSAWFTVGTTTSGISLTGSRLQLGDLTTQYLTLGTTTQQGLSMLTLEATSTTAIPLTLVGFNAQTANLLNIRNASSANLLYVTSAGNLFATGTLQVTGAVTTYGATTLGDATSDTITLSGNTSALGTLNVTGLTTLGFASTTAISLNGTTANLMVNGYATTTASNGNIATQGNIGVATTSPSLELSAQGAATTTIAAFSSSTTKGSCFQITATNGALYRMYVNPGDVATTTSGHAGIIALWEAGSCK